MTEIVPLQFSKIVYNDPTTWPTPLLDGVPVVEGQALSTSKGDICRFLRMSRPPSYGKSALIMVEFPTQSNWAGDGTFKMDYYHQVFNITFAEPSVEPAEQEE